MIGDKYTTGVAEKSESEDVVIQDFNLYTNYPNPFNPITNIEFDLPKAAYISLKIYNLLGKEIATLISGTLTAGKYKTSWKADASASGIYICCLETSEFKQFRKMTLVK